MFWIPLIFVVWSSLAPAAGPALKKNETIFWISRFPGFRFEQTKSVLFCFQKCTHKNVPIWLAEWNWDNFWLKQALLHSPIKLNSTVFFYLVTLPTFIRNTSSFQEISDMNGGVSPLEEKRLSSGYYHHYRVIINHL